MPVEVDFILGLDEHRFGRLTAAQKYCYLAAWALQWSRKKSAWFTHDDCITLARLTQIDRRTVVKMLEKCCEIGLVENHENGWKFNGLKEKLSQHLHTKIDSKPENNRRITGDIGEDRIGEERIGEERKETAPPLPPALPSEKLPNCYEAGEPVPGHPENESGSDNFAADMLARQFRRRSSAGSFQKTRDAMAIFLDQGKTIAEIQRAIETVQQGTWPEDIFPRPTARSAEKAKYDADVAKYVGRAIEQAGGER